MNRLGRAASALSLVLGLGSSYAIAAPPGPLRAGAWDWTIRSNDLGALRGRMTATSPKTPDAGLVWTSRPKALESLLSAEKAALARVFLSVAPDGSLVRIDKVTVKDDRVEGRFRAAALGEFALRATRAGDGLEGRLLASDGSSWATFTATPLAAGAPPAPASPTSRVLGKAVAVTRERWFDPKTLRQDAWKIFLVDLERASLAAQDDLEIAFAFYALKQPLKVSHYALLRKDPADAKGGAPPPPALSVDVSKAGVARLVARHFAGSASDVDDAFRAVVDSKATALVIDLRGNAGGNLSAMAVAAHLLREPAPGGTFVGARWWRDHDAPPTAADVEKESAFDRYDVDAFRARIAERGVVPTRVAPLSPRFEGRVAVLVDHRTASACEPLVAMLLANQAATVIGERTAGAMLSSDEVDLEDGWVLRIPTADYLTPAGTRLEGLGVEPTIEVDPEEAYDRALQWIATGK